MSHIERAVQNEQVTFWTQPSRFARREWPHRTLKHPYKLIAMIETGGEFYPAQPRSALPEELLPPDDMDQTSFELPVYLVRGILDYFQKHIGYGSSNVDALNRTCHHFAATLHNPKTDPYTSDYLYDVANHNAQTIVEENLVQESALPLGWWGVYGTRHPEERKYVPYHSIIGLGEGRPNISVIALRGSMGLSGYPEMHENMIQDVTTQTGSSARGEAVKLYASPYFQAYNPDKV